MLETSYPKGSRYQEKPRLRVRHNSWVDDYFTRSSGFTFIGFDFDKDERRLQNIAHYLIQLLRQSLLAGKIKITQFMKAYAHEY